MQSFTCSAGRQTGCFCIVGNNFAKSDSFHNMVTTRSKATETCNGFVGDQLSGQDFAQKSNDGGILESLAKNHLWLFAIWIVPLSVLYDVYWYFRTRQVELSVGAGCPKGSVRPCNSPSPFRFVFAFRAPSAKHEDKVRDVQRQVRQWRAEGAKKPMCTARPQWKTITIQMVTYKERMHQIRSGP